MRRLISAFAIFLLGSIGVLADDHSYTLDFTKGHNLKLVYDAGLRPWKVTDSHCMVGGNGMGDITHWKIMFSGSESFEYPSNMADFEILEGFDIGRIDFSGVDLVPVKDAAAEMKAVCAGMKIPIVGFDDYVAGLDTNAPSGARGWGKSIDIDDISFDIRFTPRPLSDRMLAQVDITIIWKESEPVDWSKPPLKKLIKNLQPPPGYEGVSMTAPTPDPNHKGVPHYDSDYYKQKIDEAKKQMVANGTVPAAFFAPEPAITIPPVPGADYIAGQDYVHDMLYQGGGWINSELQDVDVRIRYLLQTDKDLRHLKDLQTRQQTQVTNIQAGMLLPGSITRLSRSLETLDTVLVETYREEEATHVFKDHPNPTLLKEMLCHYYLYVNSQNARWPAVIDSLSKIDPALNAEALKEVKAYRDANPK